MQRGSLSALLLAGAFVAALSAGFAWFLMNDNVQQAHSDRQAMVKKLDEERKNSEALSASAKLTYDKLELVAKKSQSNEKKLAQSFATRSPADCSLGPDSARVLRDATAFSPDYSLTPAPGRKAVAANTAAPDRIRIESESDEPVSCQAVATWATVNLGRMNKNIVQAEGLQDAYEIARRASER